MYRVLEEDIRKAYAEVLEILKYIPKEEYNKIPKEVIDDMNNNKNIFYRVNLEKGISKDAEIILLDLYITYFADEKNKKLVEEIIELNEKSEIQNPKQRKELYKNNIMSDSKN